MGILFYIIPFIFLIMVLYPVINFFRFKRKSLPATAGIREVPVKKHDSSDDSEYEVLEPIIEFETSDGRKINGEPKIFFKKKFFEPGDRLEVLYHKDNPGQFIIKGDQPGANHYFFIIFGLAFLIIEFTVFNF